MAVPPNSRRNPPRLADLLLLAGAALVAVTCSGDGVTTPQEGQPAAIAATSNTSFTGTVGTAVSESLKVQVTDGTGRPVQGQRVAFVATVNGAGSALVPDTGRTDATGQASARWVLGGTAGGQTVEARVVGYALTTSFTAQAAPGAPATLALVSGDNQTGVAGTALADSLVVAVEDQYGNGVAGVTVSWTVSGGGSVSAATTPTDANGRAAVQRVLGASAGTQNTLAAVAGVNGSPVTFTHTATSGTVSGLIIVSGDNQTGPAGFPVGELKVKVVDANGNGVRGRTVTWVVATGGGSVQPTSSVTSDTGTAATTWTLGPLTGSNTLNAVSGGFSATFHATATADMPTTLAANSATSQNGTAGQDVSIPPSVKVTDANGNPVQGVGVTFAVTAGGGSVAPTSVQTDAGGIATVANWTLGPLVGTNQLTASVTGLSGSPVTFTANAGAGAASQLVILTQPPSSVQSGVVFTTDPVVQIQDANGNPVTGSRTVSVSLIGAGTLNGTLSQSTGGSDQVTFSGLSISGAAGSYQLIFTSSGLAPDTSTVISLGAGGASKLDFGQQPSNTTAGVAIAPAVTVKIEDAAGNVVSSTATVNLDLGNNPGGDPLGTVSVAAVGGVATFSSIVLQKAGAGYTLVASSTGLTSATSNGFNVSPATPATMSYTQQPSSTVAGSAITPAVKVTLFDAFGNVATGSSANVSIAIGNNPAGGTLSGTTTVAASGGVATFSNLVIDKAGTGYTLVASSTGLSGITSNAFDVQVGTGNVVAFVGQPTNVVAGSTISPAVTVEIQDGSGNVIPGATNQVTIFIGNNPSGGHLTGTVQKNAVNGVATFSNLSIDSAGTAYTLSAAATGLVSDESNSFNVLAGPPASVAIITQPSGTVQSGVAFPIPPAVLVRDAIGNVISGQAVTASLASGSNITLSNATATTNSTGVATFTGLTATGLTGTITLQFTAGTATSAATGPIAVTAGPAASVSITTQPSDTATSGVIFLRQPAVLVQDGAGNVVPSQSVTASLSGSGTLTGTTTLTTDGSGTATWSDLAIVGAGNYTLTFTAGSASAQSNTIVVIGVPTLVTITTQPSSTVQDGVVFPTVPQVRVQDALGKNIKNQAVSIEVASGNPLTFTNGTAVTGPNGVAVFTGLSVVGLVGSRTFQFTAGPATSLPSNPVSVTTGSPTAVAVTIQPSGTATSGVAFATQPSVTVTDIGNNPIPGESVTATLVGSGGTLGGTVTATTSSSGVATWSNLSITGAGIFTLQFTDGSLSTFSNSILVSPGPADSIAISTQPSATATSGVAFATQPSVTVLDSTNTPVPNQDVTATMLGSGGTLGGTTMMTTDASGVATWSDLSISGAGTFSLRFTDGSVSNTSTSIAVSPGPPDTVVINTQPSATAQAGVTFTMQPVVTVLDSTNTPVPGQTVTASLASGAGTLAGTLTATTNSSGVATFSSLRIDGTTGIRTIAFTIGAASSTSGNVDVGPGPLDPASSDSLSVSGNTAGGTTVITIQGRDQFGNAESTGGGTITATVTSGANAGATVTPNDVGDGTYTVSYPSANSGADTVDIQLDGTAISGSPLTITIN